MKRILSVAALLLLTATIMKADCTFTGTYQNSAGNTRVTYYCVNSKGLGSDLDVNWLTAVVYYGYLGL